MSWQEILASEHWKKSAVLGWLGFVVVLIRFVASGEGPGTDMVTLILGTLGISGFWQLGKRATSWTPEQIRQNGLTEEDK